MRSKYLFAVLMYALGMLTVLALYPDPDVTEISPIRERIVSRIDTIRVEVQKADSTLPDSLRMEISKLQEKLLDVDKPEVIIRDRIITDTVFVDHYIQYVSTESIKLPYVRGEISAYALSPVDSFAYRIDVDFNGWKQDNKEPGIFGLRKKTWYAFGAGIVLGVVGWEFIR